jgi:hypothetical protein
MLASERLGSGFRKMAAGTCKLVVGGRKFDGFSLSLETDRSPAYGILSGAVEPLKAAHRAGWVKVELNEGTLIDIGILSINDTGKAFITLGVDTLPEILKGFVP